MRLLVLTWIAWTVVVHAAPAVAQDFDLGSRGEVGFEGRVFFPRRDQLGDYDVGNIDMTGRLQVDAEYGDAAARGRVFSRLDPYDSERTVLVPEEIWLQGELSIVRVRAGYQMLNWSATEAFHPVDVINSRLFDGNFENPEKIGEPMLAVRVEIPNGNLELMAMPVFTAPILPSSHSRLSLTPPNIDLGEALVLEHDGDVTDERWQLQWAARVQQTWGDADIAVSFVQHIDRSMPLIVFDPMTVSVRPMYQALSQAALAYTHVLDQTILKVEAAYRNFDQPDDDMTSLGPVPERDHVLAALGIEQGLSHPNGQETAVLLEGQALIPLHGHFPKAQYPLFEHDVLIGMRHAWNDEQSSSLLFTVIIDVYDPERIVMGAAYARRLGEEWGLTAGMRLFRYPAEAAVSQAIYQRLHDAHQLYFDLKRYF
jgi:hypothetical protein